MRAMWKGAIQFGLVTIPIRMYTATEDKTLGFHQLHEDDMGRIRYKRVCATCGQEVPYDDIVKGYEVEKGIHVPLTEEDFESVPAPSSRAIDIEAFVDMNEIDPIYYQRTYYLAPEEIGAKPYHLLRQTLEQTGRVAVAKIAFRDKEHLAVVRPKGDALVLETMYWPDEIREAPAEELRPDVKVRDQEIQMAESLIDNLTEAWDPTAFTDEYREALMDVIEKKAAGEAIVSPPETEEAPVIDLMDALKASVEAAKKKKSGTAAKKDAGKAEAAAS